MCRAVCIHTDDTSVPSLLPFPFATHFAWLYLLHIYFRFVLFSEFHSFARCAAIPANGKLVALFASGGFSRPGTNFGLTLLRAQRTTTPIGQFSFGFEQHFYKVLKSRQTPLIRRRAAGNGSGEVDVDTQISEMARAKRIQKYIRQNRTMHTLLSFALDVSSEQW